MESFANPSKSESIFDFSFHIVPTVLIYTEHFVRSLSKIPKTTCKYYINIKDIELLAPITQPSKVLCIGMNYKDHCEEQNKPIPVHPVVFNKFPSCIRATNQPISYPQITKELDWEVELALIIGKKGFNIPLEKGMYYLKHKIVFSSFSLTVSLLNIAVLH